jgi:hypothetical protein
MAQRGAVGRRPNHTPLREVAVEARSGRESPDALVRRLVTRPPNVEQILDTEVSGMALAPTNAC